MDMLVDLSKAQEICGGDFSLYKSLIAILMESYEEMHRDIDQAFQIQESAAIEDTVHKLKGALRNLSAVAAVEHLQTVEVLAKNKNVHQALDQWKKGQVILTKTLEFLRQQDRKKDF
jgi:HPt (histidine-containing phosphotransfer) domain-containing protein